MFWVFIFLTTIRRSNKGIPLRLPPQVINEVPRIQSHDQKHLTFVTLITQNIVTNLNNLRYVQVVH